MTGHGHTKAEKLPGGQPEFALGDLIYRCGS